VADQWFSPDILVSSTNKTDCHNKIEKLLKVALNTITLTPTFSILVELSIKYSNKKMEIR
jgi:hypothetical protein